ncbi:MAG: endonuclease/exonuclease/phosphatase family protein [Bacteroidaceae bacterium]|nr:endonuclease/exonuclease/phosphatase family protein [Bacteroidaceae bacterium]
MKRLLSALLFVVALAPAFAQAPSEKQYALYGVAFYNLENLFDTIHAPGKNDYEYLPDGANRWGTMKYRAKVKNMATVLADLCTDRLPAGPAIVGVSEVENRAVLEDLLREPCLSGRGWEVIHIEGPDRRGVDCGFLYNPRLFQLEQTMLVPYYYLDPAQPDVDLGFYTDADNRVVPYTELKGDTTHITRGFLVASGLLAGEKFHFIVCHWPSRFAGSPVRERAGYQVKRLKDALLVQDPGCKVVIMGDMNDDPKNKSMSVELGCKHKREDVSGPGDLFNPWWKTLYKDGVGTLSYRGKWNLFDQIVFTGNLLGDDRTTLKFWRNEVFQRDYLYQQDGRYKGTPLRTHAGGVWLNGYSDHLPTYIYLVKEKP